MFEFLVGGVVGLVVGWNLFPQPVWAKALWDKAFAKFDKE